ncbi:dienelactone hydrolase [Aspergillus pseudoustus]|uniref:Dienelactone hydrolase n=1 Tax=Aspergillus pseudoustus TaxID=1810923 RepID=A0ABR4JEV5_9EURO
MTSESPASCCFTGSLHEHKAQGDIQQIGNFRVYAASPKSDTIPRKAVILLGDIFSIFPNSQLLADEFARNGYIALLPDLFNGDQISPQDYEAGKVDIKSWMSRHTVADVSPVVEAMINHLRTTLGVENVAAAGYCFGGKYVVRYLKEGQIDSGFIAHPSFVTEDELGEIQKPLSISAAEHDPIFTSKNRHASEEILIQSKQPFQINLFSGVSHGFAIRGDLNKPLVQFAKEQAFMQALVWFQHTL